MEINVNDFKCEQTEGHGYVYSCTAVSVYWVPNTIYDREIREL